VVNKKITIYQENDYDETDILEYSVEEIKEFYRDVLTKKDAKESFDCESDELSKFVITVSIEDKSGY